MGKDGYSSMALVIRPFREDGWRASTTCEAFDRDQPWQNRNLCGKIDGVAGIPFSLKA